MAATPTATVRATASWGATPVVPAATTSFLLSVPEHGAIYLATSSGDAVVPAATIIGHYLKAHDCATRMVIAQGPIFMRSASAVPVDVSVDLFN